MLLSSRLRRGILMRERETWGYLEMTTCLWTLRRHSGIAPLYYLVKLVHETLTEGQIGQMLGNLVRSGKVAKQGWGRGSSITLLSEGALNEALEGKKRFSELKWDGRWHTLVYDIPEAHHRVRMRLVRLLHQIGFAKQSASAWITPYDWAAFLDKHLAGWTFGGTVSFLRGSEVVPLAGSAPANPRELWDIDAVSDRYRAIRVRCERALRARGRDGQRKRAQALVWARPELIALEHIDPMLPPKLLPDDWTAPGAADAVETLRDQLEREVRTATE
jgi:phenylacetic acid degradation operon negative regulatory protein